MAFYEAMAERSVVDLPPQVGLPFEVFLNGVPQREGRDFKVEGPARFRTTAGRGGQARLLALALALPRNRRYVPPERLGRRRVPPRRATRRCEQAPVQGRLAWPGATSPQRPHRYPRSRTRAPHLEQLLRRRVARIPSARSTTSRHETVSAASPCRHRVSPDARPTSLDEIDHSELLGHAPHRALVRPTSSEGGAGGG